MYAAWLSCMRSLQVEDPTTEALLTPQSGHVCVKRRSRFHDIVDINRVDLCADEYGEPDDDGGPEVDEASDDGCGHYTTGLSEPLWVSRRCGSGSVNIENSQKGYEQQS
jgi:hypothetical protein